MPNKTFKFEKKEPEVLCPLRKLHNTIDYVYARKKGGKPSDVITRCRGCKIWLVAKIELAPSARFTGQESWRMESRVATKEEVEMYTKLGKVRDI